MRPRRRARCAARGRRRPTSGCATFRRLRDRLAGLDHRSPTSSTEVGEQITRVAGVKKLSLELGSNCPLIVLPDADLTKAPNGDITIRIHLQNAEVFALTLQ